jgi:hypothetical protein
MKNRFAKRISVLTVVVLSLCMSIEGCQNSANTPKMLPSSAVSPSATFYCNDSFTGTSPSYLALNPTIKVSLYVGTNPKHFRLAVHDPSGSSTVAILNGATTVPIPNIPASVDVEAAKIEIQNNGASNSDTCYEYVPQ